jgi:hypothetical protein
MTPSERKLCAQVAVHESWARTENPSARTAPARKAMLDKFEREVDPDGKLPRPSAPSARSTRERPTSRDWL